VKASSLIHGNGDRNFWSQVDVGMCSKWPASWKTPREGFDEDSSKFTLSYETKVFNPVGGRIRLKVMPASFATAPDNL
jgi:hypothetical protein